MNKENELFNATFVVRDIDPQGKSFEKVSRIVAFSETFSVELVLDVNTEIYTLRKGDNITMMLAMSLASDGVLQDPFKKQNWTDYVRLQQQMASSSRHHQSANLADQYDYVMYGKVYKFDDNDSKVTVYASFGGLLMNLSGNYMQFKNIEVGMNVYLLMRQ